jgi:ribonuclease VapC
MIVLDASTLLAFVQREPGGAKVQAMLGASVISAVNFTEVLNKLFDKLGIPNGSVAVAQLTPLLQQILPYLRHPCGIRYSRKPSSFGSFPG